MTSNVSTTSGKCPTSKDAVISLDHGDPTMFELFWRKTGSQADVVIEGFQKMSYFSDVSNACWFMEQEFASEVRRLHNLVGNAVVADRFIIVGNGSSQLIQASLYALSPVDALEPINVVSAVPYYSSYPSLTSFLRSGLYKWAGDAHAFKGDTEYIEFICSPNNPDGSIRSAVLCSENGKTIHDFAYYWPHYTAITHAADEDIMLFTVSKSTGHAGTRLGWAIVKDENVAKRMIKFIELNTIGVSKDSQSRAAKILKTISDGYEFSNPSSDHKFFDFGRKILSARWQKLREAVDASAAFSLPHFEPHFCNFNKEIVDTNPAFAWLKYEKDGESCESVLKRHKILVRGGNLFGAEPGYARISMVDRDETFNLFIERLLTIC